MQPDLQLLGLTVNPPVIGSRVDKPIESLSFLRKALLFAELADASYYSRAVSGELAHARGFPETRFYEMEGAQAYLFANEHDAVITCRGTEPHEWIDIESNLDVAMAVAESCGPGCGTDAAKGQGGVRLMQRLRRGNRLRQRCEIAQVRGCAAIRGVFANFLPHGRASQL